MNIPEVKDLTMVALSKDRIKVGCAEFLRNNIFCYRSLVGPTTNGQTLWHNGKPYWYTDEDCLRALKLMDEWQEPKPAPKFKVGDWVRWEGGLPDSLLRVTAVGEGFYDCTTLHGERERTSLSHFEACAVPWGPRAGDFVRCTNPSHPGPNPFKSMSRPEPVLRFSAPYHALFYYGRPEAHRFYSLGDAGKHSDSFEGCKPEWLVPAEEPKAEVSPRPIPLRDHWELIAGGQPLKFKDRAIQRALLEIRNAIFELRAGTVKL